MCVFNSGLVKEAGVLTVDLEAASDAFEKMVEIPWIKNSVIDILFLRLYINV